MTNKIPDYFKNYRQFIPAFSEFEKSLESKPVMSIRRNPKKMQEADFLEMLRIFVEKGWISSYLKDDFLDECFLLNDPTINIGGTWEHQLGCFYILGRSSQLAAYALDVERGDTVLDMTAAPGGKSLILAEKAGDEGIVVSNELDKNRFSHMKRNFDRMGHQNILVNRANALHLDPDIKFKKILLDGPCSSEGTFRISESKGKYFSEYHFQWRKELQKIQYKFFQKAVSLLEVGGTLLYSTCTYSPLENECIVQMGLDEFPELSLQKLKKENSFSSGILNFGTYHFSQQMDQTIRIYPHLYDSWGFFIAKFTK